MSRWTGGRKMADDQPNREKYPLRKVIATNFSIVRTTSAMASKGLTTGCIRSAKYRYMPR